MTIAQFFLNQVEWFVPDHVKQMEAAMRIRAQVVTSMLLIVIPFHIGPIIKFMALNSPVAYVNFGHMLTAIVLLAVMKATGRVTIIAWILLLTLFFQEAASIYFTGGMSSNVVGLILVLPVAGIMMVGYRAGIFFLLLLIAFILGIYYLQVIGHPFPSYNVGETAFRTEKYYYIVAVFTAYTLIAAVFQVIKVTTTRSQQEIEQRSRSMAENIQKVINEIGINSSALASSAEQLSKTSLEMQKSADQISISETETAASTNQSSSTTQELSTSLKEISKRMQELRKLADAAEDEGKIGSEIISESNEMMGMIEDSSKQIERITEIITNIAEQTNLLSLNAAIEADKAGDYGKGFAVVAEEVGELAERSNEAAKQISELIKRNDDNVYEGKEVINATGQFLEQIIEQVRLMTNEVNQLVSSITEQDIGTREVAKGAEEISQKSDKSLELITGLAALIKNSNETISSLGEIADRLDSQVTTYKD